MNDYVRMPNKKLRKLANQGDAEAKAELDNRKRTPANKRAAKSKTAPLRGRTRLAAHADDRAWR